jgi:hypothetical protein
MIRVYVLMLATMIVDSEQRWRPGMKPGVGRLANPLVAELCEVVRRNTAFVTSRLRSLVPAEFNKASMRGRDGIDE